MWLGGSLHLAPATKELAGMSAIQRDDPQSDRGWMTDTPSTAQEIVLHLSILSTGSLSLSHLNTTSLESVKGATHCPDVPLSTLHQNFPNDFSSPSTPSKIV